MIAVKLCKGMEKYLGKDIILDECINSFPVGGKWAEIRKDVASYSIAKALSV